MFVRTTHAYSWQPDLVTQSLPGVAHMFFVVNPVITPWTNNASLAVGTVVVGLAVLLTGCIYSSRHRTAVRPDPLLLLGLVATTVLLAIPVCHLYYYVILLPVIWSLWANGSLTGKLFATVSYLLLSIPSPGLTPVPPPDMAWPRSLFVVTTFFAGVLLWFAALRSTLARPVAAVASNDPDDPGNLVVLPSRRADIT